MAPKLGNVAFGDSNCDASQNDLRLAEPDGKNKQDCERCVDVDE